MIICAILGYQETEIFINFHIYGLQDKFWEIIMVGFDSLEVEEDVGYENVY